MLYHLFAGNNLLLSQLPVLHPGIIYNSSSMVPGLPYRHQVCKGQWTVTTTDTEKENISSAPSEIPATEPVTNNFDSKAMQQALFEAGVLCTHDVLAILKSL